MQTYKELYIGGEWVAPDGSEVIEVISPATEEVIGQVPHASTADADRAVAAARKAFDDGPWPHMTPVERARRSAALSAALQARAQDIADTISSENGSPKQWSIMGQVFSATMVLDTYAGPRHRVPVGRHAHRHDGRPGARAARAGRRRRGDHAVERAAVHRRAEARPGAARRVARSC